MKTLIFTLSVFLTIVSCTNGGLTPLSQTDKDQITKDVEATVQLIIDGWNSKDVNTAFALFSNSPDFTYIGVDGSIVNYSELINMAKELFPTWKDAKFTLIENKIRIINSDLVIASVIYSGEVTSQDSTFVKYPKVGNTFILNRTDDKWIVTHWQESSLAPEVIESETK